MSMINDQGATRVPARQGETLVSGFAEAVHQWPNEPAVVCDDRSLTYRELAEAALGVAARLGAEGVEAGSLVGVLCERSIEMVVALHGVLLAGAAYVPLDPEYPPNRLGYMIQETAMEVVLCQQTFADLVEVDGVKVFDLAELGGAREDVDRLLAAASGSVKPDDVAYVIYTSGSTGRPKGVANSHRGICNMISWMQDRYTLGPENVFLEKNQFSFDFSVYGFFWPLQQGAKLVMARPDGHRDATYLIETINAHRVDTIDFVPTMLRIFLDHPAAATCTSLRVVNSCGETLTRDLQDRFFEVLPDAELHNLYGPTEAAVAMTAWKCAREDERSIVPIGKAMAGNTLRILDADMREVPAGATGDLYIGGVQVAMGYVGRPDLTAERFIPDPFTPGGRLYKTGDLARWLEDGNADFLGRGDHQIKIRGYRVELGEIEAVLTEHPSVLAAAVTVAESAGDQLLIAHLMWRDQPAADASLRAHLLARLPSYMVPARFISHQALPLNTSGKVDRQALEDFEAAPLGTTKGAVGVTDPLERYLLGVWHWVLERQDISIHDRLFDIGATSLHAAAFVNEVQRRLDESIYVVTVFTSPTVAEYAELLRRDYPAAVGRVFGDGASSVEPATNVDDDLLARVDRLVLRFGPFPSWRDGSKLPRAAFILAPPRSGTTLLRVMLAGHTGIFAAPELQLLNFDTLAARADALSGHFRSWQEGAARAVMDLEGCGADTAVRLLDEKRREGLTSKELFGFFQDRARGRLVVDKSTTYAFDIEALRNIEAGFENPVYIHLTRHPAAMSASFATHHMEQALVVKEHTIPGRSFGQGVWTLSHRNIQEFAAEVDPNRLLHIRFEDLVRDPRTVLRRVAELLGVGFEEDLVRPYSRIDTKMVDGLHAASTPMGDVGFLRRGQIDASAAGDLEELANSAVLAPATRSLARSLGYDMNEQGTKAGRRRSYAAATRHRRRGRASND
jgi:amino acid adenylation domain-containing protein